MQHEKPFGSADWICRFLNETMPDVVSEITLNGDNEMSIALTKNANSQHPTKYIDV